MRSRAEIARAVNILAIALMLLATPISAGAQQAGKVARVGYLLLHPSVSPRSGGRDHPVMPATTVAAAVALALGVLAGCAVSDRGAREAAKRDYERLSGTWRLTRAVVDGAAVPEPQLRQTILITDGNTFRFPQAAGAGTHPAGTFTINPSTVPNQVDSVAIGGPSAGQVTLGIYEIIDDRRKRACWGPPGGPRPTDFESTRGSRRGLERAPQATLCRLGAPRRNRGAPRITRPRTSASADAGVLDDAPGAAHGGARAHDVEISA